MADAPEEFLCGDCRRDIRVLSAPDCPCAGLYDGWEKHRNLCEFCPRLPEGFNSVRSAFPYVGPIGDMIRNLKYRGQESAAYPLASLAVVALRDHFDQLIERKGVDLVVPVPLHPTRQWRRGFNQSERIAGEIARLLNLEFEEHGARRMRITPRQARRDTPEERLANVADAFDVVDPMRVAARRILLIDDVLTTGATVASCAAALRRAGAESVHIVTIAAAGPRTATVPDMEMSRAMAFAEKETAARK